MSGSRDQRGQLIATPAEPAALPCLFGFGPGFPTGLRTHLDLLAENGSAAPWCGPAVLALITGLDYRAAVSRLQRVAAARYPAGEPIVTAYWRDLLAVLADCAVPYAPLVLPDARPPLRRWVADGVVAGWYLLRVTDHFLLLRSHGYGLAQLHDNRLTGALLTGGLGLARRLVTHAVRLPEGPRRAC